MNPSKAFIMALLDELVTEELPSLENELANNLTSLIQSRYPGKYAIDPVGVSLLNAHIVAATVLPSIPSILDREISQQVDIDELVNGYWQRVWRYITIQHGTDDAPYDEISKRLGVGGLHLRLLKDPPEDLQNRSWKRIGAHPVIVVVNEKLEEQWRAFVDAQSRERGKAAFALGEVVGRVVLRGGVGGQDEIDPILLGELVVKYSSRRLGMTGGMHKTISGSDL
jgi:hypothetical protein